LITHDLFAPLTSVCGAVRRVTLLQSAQSSAARRASARKAKADLFILKDLLFNIGDFTKSIFVAKLGSPFQNSKWPGRGRPTRVPTSADVNVVSAHFPPVRDVTGSF